MHLGDSIFIFILALVLFGPKKLPEMARQIGKLMAEFRRASNDFRLQIDEELRTMDRQEQLEKQRLAQEKNEQAALEPSILPPALAGELTAGDGLASDQESALQVLPPAIGEQVSAGTPYAVSAPEPEDHPLLRVESIPADPQASFDQPTGMAAAQANAAQLSANGAGSRAPDHETTGDIVAEIEQPIHHG